MAKPTKFTAIKQRFSELKTKRELLSKRQWEIDRLEIILERLKRRLLARESEVVLAVWQKVKADYYKVRTGVIQAEITNQVARDEKFYRRMKYYERLRRRNARLTYEQNLLSAEIDYIKYVIIQTNDKG